MLERRAALTRRRTAGDVQLPVRERRKTCASCCSSVICAICRKGWGQMRRSEGREHATRTWSSSASSLSLSYKDSASDSSDSSLEDGSSESLLSSSIVSGLAAAPVPSAAAAPGMKACAHVEVGLFARRSWNGLARVSPSRQQPRRMPGAERGRQPVRRPLPPTRRARLRLSCTLSRMDTLHRNRPGRSSGVSPLIRGPQTQAEVRRPVRHVRAV